MAHVQKPLRAAFVSTFTPRLCGIATFTADLQKAIVDHGSCESGVVVAMHDPDEALAYSDDVHLLIRDNCPADYVQAAEYLKLNAVDVINVQHEFGIFGGPDGEMLLEFMNAASIPIVTTLHTVLAEPSPHLHRVASDIAALSARIVVLSETAKKILIERYDVEPFKIDVIPHGIPDLPFIDADYHKAEFGLAGKKVVLTFGLLSPGKGIENVIRALPEIVERDPSIHYVVLGVTHPNVLKVEGDRYRDSLKQLADELGVTDNVIFDDQFLGTPELLKYISACDVYVTPYNGKDQISSGTLSFAVGLGKPVVSTPYAYAEELLAEERGVLAPFRDSHAIAEAVASIFEDDEYRLRLRTNAYNYSRRMVWSSVADQYFESFLQAIREQRICEQIEALDAVSAPDRHPEVNLSQFARLTDSTGIVQHAKFGLPNYDEGYCTDDNARALMIATMLHGEQDFQDPYLAEEYGSTFLAFLWHAYNKEKGRFRNFMAYDRRWLETVGAEDSHGRALQALGYALASEFEDDLRSLSNDLWRRALEKVLSFPSPRSWSFALIGIDRYLSRFSGDRKALAVCKELSDRLLALYSSCRTDDWQWFEEKLSYSNASLAQALLLAGTRLNETAKVDAALEAMRWLFQVQTTKGVFVPIGSDGFYTKNQERAIFAQQPIEADVTLSAALDAFRVTQDDFWVSVARQAYDWFLGANTLSSPVYDRLTGGCRDGLDAVRVNQNQGAESTIAWLSANIQMQPFLRAEQGSRLDIRDLPRPGNDHPKGQDGFRIF